MNLDELVTVIGSLVAPAALTWMVARAAYELQEVRRERIAAENQLEKPDFTVHVTRTFVRPTPASFAIRPQIQVDSLAGSDLSVQLFQEALAHLNSQLLSSDEDISDIEVAGLLTETLTQFFGVEFSLPREHVPDIRPTAQQYLRSGGLSFLTTRKWEPAPYRRLPAYGGLGQLTERGGK